MEDSTSVLNIAESMYVRIPAAMAGYFKLKENKITKCIIKDIDRKTAKLTFE